jgi:hypothetical protein
MKRVNDNIARCIFEELSLVMKVSTKKLFLYAVMLVPVNLNLMLKKKVTIIRNLYQVIGRFVLMARMIL